MNELFLRVIQPLRPRVGWLWMLIGLAAALCVPLAIGDGALDLPAGNFFWAATLGFLLGLRSTPPRPDPRSLARRRMAALGWLLIALVGALLLALSAEDVLPFATIWQDGLAYVGWLVRGAAGTPPINRAAISFAETYPRFVERLRDAPQLGTLGVRTLANVGGITLTWWSTLLFGRTLQHGRPLFAWQLPLVGALLLLTLVGGTAFPLVFGMLLLLLCVVNSEARHREAVWEQRHVDFSDELRQDALFGGGTTLVLVLALALVLPAWLRNPVANAVWGHVETPAGFAELEAQIDNGTGQPQTTQIGLSRLPVLSLGQSVEEGPPDDVALRITTNTPLPDTPVPHYWRARLFSIYDGTIWTTDARVAAQPPSAVVSATLPGIVLQTVEDTRRNRSILPALPDAFAVDVPTNSEVLPDGAQAALTSDTAQSRYRVFSRPQEFAVPPRPDAEPPDMSAYLALPSTVTSRVVALARRLAGEQTTPYQQALALETYLRGLSYSYQVTPLPANGDAVDFFLFNTNSGYCTYYASAMAVMARTLGVPARVASGYVTGRYDAATQTYTVLENDAHAWPELYIDGRWLPFEPTPIRPLPARTSAEPPPVVAPVPVPLAVPVASPNRAWWWLVLLAGMLLLGAWWWRRRGPPPTPLWSAQQQFQQIGARAGVAWPPGATLQEYAALLAPRLAGSPTALRALVALFERARYGEQPLDAVENDALWRELRLLREQLAQHRE